MAERRERDEVAGRSLGDRFDACRRVHVLDDVLRVGSSPEPKGLMPHTVDRSEAEDCCEDVRSEAWADLVVDGAPQLPGREVEQAQRIAS